ncbi:unnamed protein product [Wuchereria bancrofti]|uniref:Uncharacterized protein n=1 Tax=Wuchereria bancrofti TaxID=6293 RepID=A0A3P7E1C3_WUCBA|nr:unnamed protein product [Wuchereria bancrofti]
MKGVLVQHLFVDTLSTSKIGIETQPLQFHFVPTLMTESLRSVLREKYMGKKYENARYKQLVGSSSGIVEDSGDKLALASHVSARIKYITSDIGHEGT